MSIAIEPIVSLREEGFGYKMRDTVLCTEKRGESLRALDCELVVIDWTRIDFQRPPPD